MQDDVWEAVGQQAKKDQLKLPATVKQIMDTWTLKKGIYTLFNVASFGRNYNHIIMLKGFPVVFIQRDYQNNTNRVTIKQV